MHWCTTIQLQVGNLSITIPLQILRQDLPEVFVELLRILILGKVLFIILDELLNLLLQQLVCYLLVLELERVVLLLHVALVVHLLVLWLLAVQSLATAVGADVLLLGH